MPAWAREPTERPSIDSVDVTELVPGTGQEQRENDPKSADKQAEFNSHGEREK